MTFAGFWVDGAVRRPEERHCDADGLVITRHKETGKLDKWDIGNVEDVDYWLDTTPRESLTPEELFSVVKVLWPRCNRVLNPSGASVGWQFDFDDTNEHTNIDWGDLTQYPPSVETQWIRVTRENVAQFMFRLCRCKNTHIESWQDGHIVGWDMEDGCCLVDGDSDPVERVMKYDFVEVQA